MALKSGRVGIHPSQVDPITGMLTNLPPSGAQIDDTTVSTETVWSSDKVDDELSNKAPEKPIFTQAGSRISLTSNTRIELLFGRISKWLADLKAVAFSGSYYQLTDTPDIPEVYWTDSDFVTSGATSITLTTTDAGSDAVIEPFSKNTSNTPISYDSIAFTPGTLTYNVKLLIPISITVQSLMFGVTFTEDTATPTHHVYTATYTQPSDLYGSIEIQDGTSSMMITADLNAWSNPATDKLNTFTMKDYTGGDAEFDYTGIYPQGTITLTFPALTETTYFRCRITNIQEGV